MHSHLVLAPTTETALKAANQISPFPIINSMDCLVVTPEDSIGIDAVRNIKVFLSKKPYQETHKVVYIHPAHLLTLPAQNALLKTLEEPPENSLIILSATHQNQLIPTIVSRCQLTRISTIRDETIDATISQLITDIKQSSVARRVTLANKYAYPKDKAQSLCTQLILHSRRTLHSQPTQQNLNNLKIAQQSLNRLNQNVNPNLTLEQLFIHYL